jgi:hypothetical protein
MGQPKAVRPIPGSVGHLGLPLGVVFLWVAAMWALGSIPGAWLDLVFKVGPLMHVKSM